MQISNKMKKCGVLTLILMIIFAEGVLGYLLEPSSYATYFNHELDQLEAEGRNVDMILIGASRVYRSFVPEEFEKKMGLDFVLNAGSSYQPIEGSYYQLKELLDRFNPKYVVLGVTWDGISNDRTRGKLIIYDRLHGSEKLKYTLTDFSNEEFLYTLKSYRYRNEIVDIAENIQERKRLVETDYEPKVKGNEYYADSGFVYSYDTFENGNVEIRGGGTFDTELAKQTMVPYMDKIVSLCKQEGIRLYMVTGPTTMMRIYNVGNYQEAVDFYDNYAQQNDIIYHNLNYLKNRETIFDDSLMHDFNHLNGKGATVVSSLYAEILQKDMQGIDTSDYFYGSLDELKSDVNRVVGVKAAIETDNGYAHIKATSLQNEGVVPQYQILAAKSAEDEYQVVADWSTATEWSVDVAGLQARRIMIRAKIGNPGETEAFQIYKLKKSQIRRSS